MALSVLDCQKAIADAGASAIKKVADGHGLYLFVKNGRAFWTLQFRKGDSWSSRGFGSFPDVTPKQAREKVADYKHDLKNGTAPASAVVIRMPRKAAAAGAGKPFKEAVAAWLAVASKGKKGVPWADKTRLAVERALLRLVDGGLPDDVSKIDTAAVIKALSPIPARQREDVRANLARVLAFCVGNGWLAFGPEGNPAKFNTDTRRDLLPAFAKSGKHHAAVNWNDAPALYKSIPTDTEAGRALRFLLLTVPRAGELEKATWSEIERDNGNGMIWRRPAAHMKLRKEHCIPLTPAALALLGERGEPDAPLFNLVSNAMLDTLKAIRPDATVHGLRSTFRDWEGDHNIDRDAAEMSLAHDVGDAVERAYSRSQWLARRRDLLDKWTAHISA